MKWTKPSDGACYQTVIDGWRYFIQDIHDCTMVAIFRVPAVKTERHKFQTFRDMYKSLFGSDAPEHWDEVETQIEIRRRGRCHYGLWDYKAPDGKLYSLDLREKEYHEYFEPEKVSPALDTIPDAKSWAEEYLETTKQMRLEF